MIKRALISVSDKTGINEFARGLFDLGIEIISTGGTAVALQSSGIPVVKISDVTGFPEIMNGRVKTLHPKIHGGLLAVRDNKGHMDEAQKHGIGLIDLLAVNLYPFESTISKEGVSLEDAIENIDIGGPSMIRSAAKNYRSVAVLVNPCDYERILTDLRSKGDISDDLRYELMIRAFEHTARYDTLISSYFGSRRKQETFPELQTMTFKQIQPLRYGENPHQRAAFYTANTGSPKLYEQIHGKELSYNNILDLDACVRVVSDFSEPCCVIVKHTNPCGAAIHNDPFQAYQNARATDPVSAFGGVIGFNVKISAQAAEVMSEVFVEAIIAPEFDEQAIVILSKKKNIRLIRYDFANAGKKQSFLPEIRRALDGYLIQDEDDRKVTIPEWKVVTKRTPTPDEKQALEFGWRIVKHVKSNAVVYSSPDRTIGVGAGQMSRVDSSQLAVAKAQKSGLTLKGSIVASDAFFPFRDGIDAAAQAGATAAIQPGGSVKDQEVIDAADEHGMAMIFTGVRHFKH